MESFLDVLLDSTLDTLKLLPFLVVVYFLIEYLEYKNIFKFENSKLLSGKYSPIMGALVGSVPQCGFSVVSSELYAKQKISVGALIAVYVATSDEALPIMLSNYKAIPSLLLLIATKIVMAIAIGYISMFLYKKIFTKQNKKSIALSDENFETKSSTTKKSETEHKPALAESHSHENHEHNHTEHKDTEHSSIHACCHHDLESNKYNWKHPLVHCLKISLYIFIINLVMGTVVAIVGEESLTKFLKSSNAFQPLLALLIGLIPNCASSVILTELYLMGGLSFGAIVTGLSVNAGIGFIFLLKENKNTKENIFILSSLIISSLIFGYALHFIPFGFLGI